MKAQNKLVILLTMGMAMAAGANAQSQDDAPPPPGHAAGQGHRPPPLGPAVLDLLDKYDKNHDGMLDQNEMAELKQDIQAGKIQPQARPPRLPKEIMDKYDVNHDGVLDESEREALHQDVQSGKVQLPMPGRGGPGGPGGMADGPRPGPGEPSPKQLISKYDINQ